MASRLNRRGRIIPAQTDHLEDNGGVIGADIHRFVGGFFVFFRSTFLKGLCDNSSLSVYAARGPFAKLATKLLNERLGRRHVGKAPTKIGFALLKRCTSISYLNVPRSMKFDDPAAQ